MIIIGLQGKKGVGKNFVASVVQQKVFSDKKVLIYAFADPIKEFLSDIVGLDKDKLYGNDDQKNAPTEYLWKNMPEWLRKKFPSHGEYVTYREALQFSGTELNREIWDRNIWVKAMHRRILRTSADVVIIADVRFQEEIVGIHEWGGKIWRIEGVQRGKNKENIMNDAHISEKVMDSTVGVDYVIENQPDDTPESLVVKLKRALENGAL